MNSLKTEKDVLALTNNTSSNQKNTSSNANEESTTCLTECSPNDNSSDTEKKYTSHSFERKLTPSFSSSSKGPGKSSRKIKAIELPSIKRNAMSIYETTMYNKLE